MKPTKMLYYIGLITRWRKHQFATSPSPTTTPTLNEKKKVLITALINGTHHNRKTCCWCGGYKWTHSGTDMLIESNFPVSKKKVKNGNCLILFKLIYVCLTFSKIGLLKLINKHFNSSSLNKRNSNHDGGPLYIWFSYRFVQLYFSVFSLVLVSTEQTYQTLKTVFHHIFNTISSLIKPHYMSRPLFSCRVWILLFGKQS